jgi:glycosyltransferase involved in cell wall biosynthesis
MGLLSRIASAWTNSEPASVQLHGNSKHDLRLLREEASKLADFDIQICEAPWTMKNSAIHLLDGTGLSKLPLERMAKRNSILINWTSQLGDITNIASTVQTWICSSSSAADRLHGVGSQRANVVIIPHGIDLKSFRPCGIDRKLALRRQLGIARNATCIGAMDMSIDRDEAFVETIRIARAEVDDLCVLVAGANRDSMTKRLMQLGIPAHRIPIDSVANRCKFYGTLDAYVIASTLEADSVTLLECWATGVPVVSVKVGMVADHVIDGINGGLGESVQELANALVDMCFDSNHRHGCQQRALHDVKQFDWSRIASRYVREVYRPLLSASKAA